MKMLNLILSIYVTLLSCLPCADMDANSLAHSSIDHSIKHDNHSHDLENDLCSPFCSCNCCGQQIMTIFPSLIYENTIKFKEIKSSISIYKSVFTSNFYGSIWQPPQIV